MNGQTGSAGPVVNVSRGDRIRHAVNVDCPAGSWSASVAAVAWIALAHILRRGRQLCV